MQVKCFFQHGQNVLFADMAADFTTRLGSTTLETYKGKDMFDAPNEIVIASANFKIKQSDALYILGGRASILQWLRGQGKTPTVRGFGITSPLYAKVMRKKQLFDKNMTMVALVALQDMVVQSTNWKAKPDVALQTPAAFQPEQLAQALEGIFHHAA